MEKRFHAKIAKAQRPQRISKIWAKRIKNLLAGRQGKEVKEINC